MALPGALFSSSASRSKGSPSLRMSHQSTSPSVDVEAHSFGDLPGSHATSYTGSQCDLSRIDESTGLSTPEPLRVSQYETSPL